jgi:glyoxylase-like metal-dependent hydrolase (beta-lactamase superfamily II)
VVGASRIRIVLTHGHSDHAGGVDRLLANLADQGAGFVEVVGAGHVDARRPEPGSTVPFDAGHLEAVPTPGHTADHLAWFWPQARAVFAGDHVLGYGDTTWVAEYPGCVADYLASLDVVRALDPVMIHPGHGPSIDDPGSALDRFEAHRRKRIDRVRDLRRARPGLSGDDLYRAVYGTTVPPGLEGAARRSLAAVEDYLDTEGSRGVSSGS